MSTGSMPKLPIPRRVDDGSAPLSFAQERMWFLHQLEPDSAAYNVLRATRWVGPLAVDALERSLAEVIRRHEILRTRFPLTERGVVQDVMPFAPFHLPLQDFSGLPEVARESAARRWMLREAGHRFDVTEHAPVRATLLRLAAEEHWLVLLIHHLATDRWSRGVLLKELFALYAASVNGSSAALPELPIQYGDYAAWQREGVRGVPLQRELAYWRNQLADAPPLLTLPTDRPRPATQTYAGARLSFTLPPPLAEAVSSLARQVRATPFMVLLAAFEALLSRFSGETDLIVGAPVAGRDRLQLERLIGCFTNTLVLRTDLSGDPTFREIVERARGVLLSGFDHQVVPFEKLVEELRPSRDPRYHTMFQVLVNCQNFPDEVVEVCDVRVEDIELAPDTALVDLAVDLKRTRESWLCCFIYNTDLFDASTIGRLAHQYGTILELATADPDRPLSTLPPHGAALPQNESDRLLQELDAISDEEAERLLAAELSVPRVSDAS